MIIFIIVDCLTIGGAERVASDLSNGLHARGHRVIIYTNTSYPITYKPYEGVEIRDFKPLNIFKCFKPIRFLSREIKKEKPDVLIGFCGYFSFLCKIAQVFSGLNIPVVYSEHNALERPDYAKLNIQNIFYKYYFSRWCDAMTVLTEADKKYAKRKLHNLHVLPNPLGLLPCKTLPRKEKIVLAVGRLKVWHCKGFDLLINAWGKICKKHPDWRLVIVGNGGIAEKQAIHSFAEQAQCSKQFELLPYTDDIISYYQKSSIYVLSSRYEGFGLVLIEAMSQGCACVAADYKGRQSEIITNGIDGIICNTESVNELSDGLETLINNDLYRSQLQKKAIETSYRFSLSKYSERWETLIQYLKMR